MPLVLRAVCGLAMLSLLAADVPQDPGDVLVVTRKATKLRSQQRSFAPAVADLREGDRLTLRQRSGAWFAVRFGEIDGFVHAGDVSGNPDVRLSGQGVRETYSTSETAAARKGFNPQVERSYRGQNPDLDRAFRLVDALQARSVPEAEIAAFLRAGRLLREDR